jgi:peptide-methionine (R)-S-oxide reductase
MNRRTFLVRFGSLMGILFTAPHLLAKKNDHAIKKLARSNNEWLKRLSFEQYRVLREEGTEPSFSSSLNKEYGPGVYVCAGCELDLFSAEMKYDSGTGWPSFFQSIEGHLETKLDFKLIYPRTEYHCARCEGHQGHLFTDGPKPSGKRWCNNGIALKFMPGLSHKG